MSSFPQDDTLFDSLLRKGINFRRSAGNGDEINLCCPFCGDGRFRLGINVQKNIGHCFNCNFRTGNALEELSKVLDLGVLSESTGQIRQDDPDVPEEIPAPALPDDFELLSRLPRDILGRRALNYLLERNVTKEQIKEKKIGVSLAGRYAYRIVFPVYYGKELQGLVTRDFTGKQEPKYLNSRGMKAVYNSPVKKKSSAVLCEGIFDCLALERVLPVDNHDVLALLGHGLTDTQYERLEKYETIILWPDADIPGIKGFIEVGRQLLLNHKVWIVPPSASGKDAAEVSPAHLSFMWTRKIMLNESVAMRLRVEMTLRE